VEGINRTDEPLYTVATARVHLLVNDWLVRNFRGVAFGHA